MIRLSVSILNWKSFCKFIPNFKKKDTLATASKYQATTTHWGDVTTCNMTKLSALFSSIWHFSVRLHSGWGSVAKNVNSWSADIICLISVGSMTRQLTINSRESHGNASKYPETALIGSYLWLLTWKSIMHDFHLRQAYAHLVVRYDQEQQKYFWKATQGLTVWKCTWQKLYQVHCTWLHSANCAFFSNLGRLDLVVHWQ